MTGQADNAGCRPGLARAGAVTQGELPSWELEDAKARFSEVVRLARERGPQRVKVHGQDAVVVLSAADYARLAPAAAAAGRSLAAVFSEGAFGRLEDLGDGLVRERVPVRGPPDLGS